MLTPKQIGVQDLLNQLYRNTTNLEVAQFGRGYAKDFFCIRVPDGYYTNGATASKTLNLPPVPRQLLEYRSAAADDYTLHYDKMTHVEFRARYPEAFVSPSLLVAVSPYAQGLLQ